MKRGTIKTGPGAVRALLLTLLLLLVVQSSRGRAATDTIGAGFTRLADRYHSRAISDSVYLEQCYVYATSLLAGGTILGEPELLQYLHLFRELAWGNDRNEKFKKSYYALLANHAQMANRGGAMLYYAEKLESMDQQQEQLPIAALTIRADFYRERKAYDKVKKIYAAQRVHFAALPEARGTEMRSLVQAMIYLEKTGDAMAKLPDTLVSNEIYTLMGRIAAAIKSRNSKDPIYDAYAAYCMARALNNKAVAGHNMPMRVKAMALLDRLQRSPETPDVLKSYAGQTFAEMKIAYYADRQEADSLLYWLNIYASRGNTARDYDTRYYIKSKKAQAYLVKGDTARSIALLQEAAALLEKSRIEMLQDIDGILYAHADAEEKNLELTASANKVRERTLLVVLVCTLSACTIIGLQVYFYRSRKALQQRIRQLGHTVDLQVELLEELKPVARYEEQQRISRELHDEWSPGLASAMHQVGFIAQDTGDEKIKPALDQLQVQLSYTYNSLRNFSHRLYHAQAGVSDHLFENRIRDMVAQAFPNPQIVKNILIADGTMMHIGLNGRIELLRILQESVINILRHAAATEVTVLLYEEAGNVSLTIADNGRGFDVSAKLHQATGKGMGLHSIKERARSLKGSLVIESAKGGTSVQVLFPAGDDLQTG